MNKLLKYFLFSICLLTLLKVKVMAAVDCSSESLQCIKCTYTYEGTAKSAFTDPNFFYIIKADGNGSAEIVEKNNLSTTKKYNNKTIIIKSHMTDGDFISEEEPKGLICPNIVLTKDWLLDVDGDDTFVIEYNSTTQKTGRIITPKMESNNKPFRPEGSEKEPSTSKVCLFAIHDDKIPNFKVTYNPDTEEAVFKVTDDRGNSYKENFVYVKDKHKKYLENTVCDNVPMYVKVKKLSDGEDSYIYYPSYTRISGFTKMTAMDDTSDPEKIKNKLKFDDNATPIIVPSNCESMLGDPTASGTPAWYLSQAFKILRYVAIALLVVLTGMDFISATASHNEDELQKVLKKAAIRIVICVVIFLLPLLIEFILSIINDKAVDICINATT